MSTPLVLVYNIYFDLTLTLPIQNGTITSIDWGDGITTTNQTKTHTYPDTGEATDYFVQIRGTGITTFDYTLIGTTCQDALIECRSFGTIGLTNMSNMFRNCTELLVVPASLPTNSTVTNISNMFHGAINFNQNIGGWNVSSVTNMYGVFYGATSFNGNIGSWNVSNVTNMFEMFVDAASFNQNIGSWNVSKVTNMTTMLSGTALSTTNYNALLNGWSSRTVIPNVTLSAEGLTYTSAGVAGRNILTSAPRNWNIIDSGLVCFKEGTKILTDTGYIPIENLKKGDLVKTLKHGYKPIDAIAKKEFYNPALKDDRIKDQLYKCSQEQYPEVFEDLFITGGHAILVDDFKDDNERNKVVEIYGKIYETDNKYRLLACVDERASVYEVKGDFTIYHFSLENDDDYLNYGVYANGLLVESCLKFFLKDKSKMSTF